MEAHRRIRNLTLGQLMQRCDPKLTNVPKEVLEEGMLRHYFGEKAVPAKQRMLMREVELVCERHVYNFVINLQKAKDYVSFMNETDSDSIMRALVRLKEF